MSECTSIVVTDNTIDVAYVYVTDVGPAGANGNGTKQILLNGTVSGGLAVSSKGVLADINLPYELLGVALQSGNAGTTINVATDDLVTENGWNWTPDLPVFLGNAGQLTQVVPVSGYILIVGFAQSATTLLVRPGSPIQQ
jgi:hypothetical protein